MSHQSEGEREKESKGERFQFTAEKVTLLLTFLSTLKKSEYYKSQAHGMQRAKLIEQLDDLKSNSILFSGLSTSTYKEKVDGVLETVNKFYRVAQHTNSVQREYANWEELYEHLPFNVKFTNALDRDGVCDSLTLIATNMTQTERTPREKKELSELRKVNLKINKAKRGREAVSSGNIIYRNSNIINEANDKHNF